MKDDYDFTGARRGSIAKTAGKTRITIYLDDDILSGFRERAGQEGKGYQTLINETLRAAMSSGAPVTEETLRRVLREELKVA